MPEISSKYVPAHMFDKDPNPKLLKFVRRVTDRLPGKVKGITAKDPEYWGFACIFESGCEGYQRDTLSTGKGVEGGEGTDMCRPQRQEGDGGDRAAGTI